MPSKNHQFRFYADECIPIPSVTFLREKGVNVIHVADRNKTGKSDAYQFKFSKQLERIFLTLDHDFRQGDSFFVDNHPGIILIQVTSPTPKNINQVLDKILKILTVDFVKNAKVKVSINKVIKEKGGNIFRKNI